MDDTEDKSGVPQITAYPEKKCKKCYGRGYIGKLGNGQLAFCPKCVIPELKGKMATFAKGTKFSIELVTVKEPGK